MEFNNNKAIYLQISSLICTHIIIGELPEEEKIPSVRELAANIEVNPNTVMRAYAMLQEDEIVYNKRGIGFFVQKGAAKQIRTKQKNNFLKNELIQVFEKMELLDIPFEEIIKKYKTYKK